MSEYDYQFLRRQFLDYSSLKTPACWLPVAELPPTPFVEVLITGPVAKHKVGYLDCGAGAWIVGDQRVAFDDYPHWMPLPAPPLYD